MFDTAEPDRSSFVIPALAGAALVGGLLLRRARRHAAGAPHDAPGLFDREDDAPMPGIDAGLPAVATTTLPTGRWIYPLPRWQGRAPVISDGWGSPRDGGLRRHRGADLMYRRRTRDELTVVFPPRAPHSAWHFLPPGTVALAAADADVWSAGEDARGHVVVLSHGAPWATCYRHLARLFLRETARGTARERVRAGQPIGIVGADPTDPRGIAHLHFEVWYRGGAEAAVNPAALLSACEVIDTPPMPAVKAVA